MPSRTASPRRTAPLTDGNGAHRVTAPTTRLAPAARRRSTTAIVAAILCIAGGALVGVVAFKAGSARQSVLATTHTVAAGHVLQASDLRVVDVSTDGGLSLVLASDEDSILGRPAAVPIAAGAPLTSSDLGSTPVVGRGEAVIGVLCKAGQYPPSLSPGDRVEVIDAGASSPVGPAGGSSLSPGSSGAGLTATVYATVIGIDAPPDTATVGTVVSLRMSSGDTLSVARAAAGGRITLILVPPGS